jgi:hypothetical protein
MAILMFRRYRWYSSEVFTRRPGTAEARPLCTSTGGRPTAATVLLLGAAVAPQYCVTRTDTSRSR